ncbi:MAG: M50 family metallopeptidase [Elusimicrobiales bacterium]|nr:M50 family metallopeptidase [Elusimicrobiales bacterium]
MIESILGVIFTFGIIVFIHEFGHFVLCKILKVHVEEFSFGFGKPLYQKIKLGTLYSIRIIPLGGYVKPKGEDITEYKGETDEYFSKKWYERIMIVLAGPIMNYLLSFVIFWGVIYMVGKPLPSSSTIIGDLAEGFPAHLAGMRQGDKIVAIDNVKVETWKDMMVLISSKIEKEIKVEYERDGKRYTVSVKTKKDPTADRGIIGIVPQTDYEKVGFFTAAKMSYEQIVYWTSITVKTLARSIYRREKPDVAGPIGIIQIVSKAAHSDFADFMFLVGLISIAVGFFNLLPLPLLDGGHFIIYLFEGVFRKKITPTLMKYVSSLGILILVGILIFATYSDVTRIYNSYKARVERNETGK